MTVPEGYRAQSCGGCGHTVGDHQSAGIGWPHPPLYGLCLHADCDCREFISDNPDSDARNYDAMRDEQATNFGEVPEDTDFAFHRHADSSFRRDPAAPSRPDVDPQAPPTHTSRSAALADTSTRPDAQAA